jgi:hypothetical protein
MKEDAAGGKSRLRKRGIPSDRPRRLVKFSTGVDYFNGMAGERGILPSTHANETAGDSSGLRGVWTLASNLHISSYPPNRAIQNQEKTHGNQESDQEIEEEQSIAVRENADGEGNRRLGWLQTDAVIAKRTPIARI